MIHFITPSDQIWIIHNLKERFLGNLSSSVRALSYHDFSKTQNLEPGFCILTGLCVLTDIERETALEICNELEKSIPSMKVMNHPEAVLNRYELLKVLYEMGINDFRAYRVDEIETNDLTYPVFVREVHRHTGGLTDLLYDFESVKKAIRNLVERNYVADDLLVVEYCHTADETGLFRKYSAQKMGDAILPRYLSLDYHWVVKENSPLPEGRVLYDSDRIAEEIRYMKENPHEDQVREIFDIAALTLAASITVSRMGNFRSGKSIPFPPSDLIRAGKKGVRKEKSGESQRFSFMTLSVMLRERCSVRNGMEKR